MPSKDYEISPKDEKSEEQQDKDSQTRALEKKAKNMVRIAVVMGAIALIALGVILGLVINFSIANETNDDVNVVNSPLHCGNAPEEFKQYKDQLGDSDRPGVFHALTVAEILRVREYFETRWNFPRPSENTTLKDPRIYTMDLELPPKTEVLNYLDHGGQQPDRRARVIIFRGDLTPPVVEERICGPLHNITDCPVAVEMPFAARPIETREYTYMEHHLVPEIQKKFGSILRESFNGSFDLENCEDDCMNWWQTDIGSNLMNVSAGTTFPRKIWFIALYDIPYYLLYPVGMAFLCNVDGVDEYAFSVEKVWYNDRLYDDPDDFIGQYNAGNVTKLKISYPRGDETMFSSMKTRGTEEETKKRQQRPPQLIEPDGKRYTVQYDKVEYLGLWSFHYRISPIYGPAIYDVRFQGERIAFEISLMEIIVQYSGAAPTENQCLFVDTSYALGSRSKVLVGGADCPDTATYLRFVTSAQDNYDPAVFPQGACVFEQNSGQPLRRHHSYSKDDGAFYGGMLDSALVVRSIHTVDNYDYVLDFNFHQNGALGVKVLNTGYIMSSFYYTGEDNYGAQIGKNLLGPVHMHAAHFKVDVDINGVSNRYETLDIKQETVKVAQTPSRTLSQTKVSHNLKDTEEGFIYNFQQPKYHIFYKETARNSYGVRKAYRLVNSGQSAQITTFGSGNELAYTWARYQIAVTKRKEDEPRSSSPYNQWQTMTPFVEFENFINGEDIRDEDLVAWVSLATQHIPSTEDLPVTTTPGQHNSFYLLPYNYFTEDPSMKSPDSVYIAYVDIEAPEKGLVVDYLGSGDITQAANFGTCSFMPKNVTDAFVRDPDSLFESTYNKGVY